MRKCILALVLTVLSAGAYSFLTTSPTHAQTPRTDVDLAVNPGSFSTKLTCGWHQQCICIPVYCYGPDYQGLDWGNFSGEQGNDPIFWRSFAWRSRNDTGTDWVARGNIFEAHAGCLQFRVEVQDFYGYIHGNVFFVHSDTAYDGLSFQILADVGAWRYTFGSIGYTIPYEYRCRGYWDAPHLHQFATIEFARNRPFYPDAPAELLNVPVYLDGYWQNRKQWCWFC